MTIRSRRWCRLSALRRNRFAADRLRRSLNQNSTDAAGAVGDENGFAF
jgi:hypothetical protein